MFRNDGTGIQKREIRPTAFSAKNGLAVQLMNCHGNAGQPSKEEGVEMETADRAGRHMGPPGQEDPTS